MATVIGLCGPSGCGKSTLAEMLSKAYENNVLGLDNYFLLDPPYKKYDTNGKNWELPENVDWAAIRNVVSRLRSDRRALARKIDWATESISDIVILPKPYLIVEGFLLLHDVQLVELLDLAVYIDIPDTVGIQRRMDREESTENQKWFEEVTFPEYKSRRKLFESRASLVLDGENTLQRNLTLLHEAIASLRK